MVAAPARLEEFVQYSKRYIRGDEKSEAQPFLNEFFRAFGYEGARQAGAEFEYRIDGGSSQGNKGYADLVWKSRLLIEMKSRTENLHHHYRQVERYWMRLTPKPRYAILSNFDEFWIYDFHNQVDTPVDVVRLDELPIRTNAFRFMVSETAEPIFLNNQVEATEQTAQRVGVLYQSLIDRAKRRNYEEFNETDARRFVLQCVLAMFAEDRGLLPQDLFIACVRDCLNGQDTYDVLGGLFREMNQPGITPVGRYKGVEYFNGGLFSQIHPIQLTEQELKILDVCATGRWHQVRPSIFGSIFESSTDDKLRHAHGMHFTSEADIRQIVIPTITEYWESLIDGANTVKELNGLQQRLIQYRTLDPACGSGNFLYVAYQELKQVELKLLNKLNAYGDTNYQQLGLGFVSPNQFYGMDINPFAVELARVTMMISRKVAIDHLQLKDEPALPLDSLDGNIVCQDALFSDWVKADAIIGNPPFLGGSRIRSELGDEYAEKLYHRFNDVKDQPDLCSYWFRLAHQNLDGHSRAGLVGTNTISQGRSRTASLDYIAQNGGHIHTAISSQPWFGESKVHVSIVNWSKERPRKYRLDNSQVLQINSSLKSNLDVTKAVRLAANRETCFEGVKPYGKGFIVTQGMVIAWVKADSRNRNVLKPLLDATSLTNRVNGQPERWIIDFNHMELEEAISYHLPFAHVKQFVKPERELNRVERTRNYWWRFERLRPAMREAIFITGTYFAVPRVSKWSIFTVGQFDQLPDTSINVVAASDFYVLGILTSRVHRNWFRAQCSTLKADTRYTPSTCFETFPFPQKLSRSLAQEIRGTMEDLNLYRTQTMETHQWGITKLYNALAAEPSSRLYKLHQILDRLVMQAYGFEPGDDLLEGLLALNLEVADKESRRERTVGAELPRFNKTDNVDYSIAKRVSSQEQQA